MSQRTATRALMIVGLVCGVWATQAAAQPAPGGGPGGGMRGRRALPTHPLMTALDADKEGYIDYLEKLLPLVRPGGLVLAHNMNPRQADARYVKAITTNADLETIFLHMDRAGVGVTLKKRPARKEDAP